MSLVCAGLRFKSKHLISQDMATVGRALASQAFATASPGVAAASRVEDCAHLSSSDVFT